MNEKAEFSFAESGKHTVSNTGMLWEAAPAVPTRYIDADKIQTFDDVREILRCMALVVYDDGSERFAGVRKLYKDESP